MTLDKKEDGDIKGKKDDGLHEMKAARNPDKEPVD